MRLGPRHSHRRSALALLTALPLLGCRPDRAPVSAADTSWAVSPTELSRVVVEEPLRLHNPLEHSVRWPIWGASMRAREPVEVRVELDSVEPGAGFVLAGPGTEAQRSSVSIVRGDQGWVLSRELGTDPIEQATIDASAGEALHMRISAGGRSVAVRTQDGSEHTVPLSRALAPTGEAMGLYVHLDPHADLEIASLRLSEPVPSSPLLEPPLRALAAEDLSIGTATDTWPPRHDYEFERLLGQQFDLAAPSEFYWTTTRPEPDAFFFVPADLMVNYAKVHDQRLRGYFLVWDLELPKWVQAVAESSEAEQALGRVLDEHIETTVTRYRDDVEEWVVVNEAIWGPEATGENDRATHAQTPWLQALGPDYIERAFRAAREADPDAVLLYNETGAETLGPKSDFMVAMLSDLLERGVPIDGVGLQFHIDATDPPPMADVVANMQRLADLGLDIYITELDVNLLGLQGGSAYELQTQARLYTEVLQACGQVDACRSYTTWGFSDAHAWYDREGGAVAPAMFDRDYRPKPAFFAIQEALAGLRNTTR